MPHQTDQRSKHLIEGSTFRLDYTLKDENGDTITAALDAQSATIYDEATGVAIPSWTDEDIKGLQGNVVTSGVGVWDLPASASAKLNDSEFEEHIVAIKSEYGSSRVLKHFIRFRVYRQPVGG